MTIEDADAVAAYLGPEIAAGLEASRVDKLAIRYKQCGVAYIESCKAYATDANGDIDPVALRSYILAAVTLLQNYHDAI